VLVGGFAAVLHGCNHTTRDIDICIAHSPDQIRSLLEALSAYHPQFRDKSKVLSEDLYLKTDLGVLDVINHVLGVGTYFDVLKNSDEIELYGGKCRLISIEDLIKSKKAVGRHRDLVTVAELEAIWSERLKNNR
jgi:hypothetical protein